MKLKITLLSDFCTGSGDGFNSTIDTDAVFDEYGFPYIPAKRLKGCIRESCLELEEFGVIPMGSVTGIFGREGDMPSLFFLSDAYPEQYEDMLFDLVREKDKILTNYQNVAGLYSYTRTQTALNPDTGTAEKNSLRTIRVVKRGMVFEADLIFSPKMIEQEKEYLKLGAELVTHMGIHRTRGLGTVKITLQETKEKEYEEIRGTQEPQETVRWKFGERNKIFYSILLKSSMLNKSPEGSQTKTQPYIEGGKVLGLLAGTLGKEKFQELMQEELIVSNAYIMCSEKRCSPLPVSLQKRKDQGFDEEGKMEVVDMLYAGEIHEQMTPVGGKFADSDGHVVNVDTEIQYHHRRPEDKSIGHANGLDQSAFYQMESVHKGQKFAGMILATKKQAEMVCRAVSSIQKTRMGYAKNAQYGAVEVSIDKAEVIENEKTAELVHDFQIKLNAPVILYNQNGMYSADAQVFCEYLREAMEIEDLVLDQMFLSYETIGGFNVTWKRRKPMITAIGKGSVCTFHTEAGATVRHGEILFIGERISEGYGEILVSTEKNPKVVLYKECEHAAAEQQEENRTNLISLLAKEQCRREIQAEAIKDAMEAYQECFREKEADAVVSRLLQICREQNNADDMVMQAEGTESDKKRELTQPLIKRIKAALEKEYPSKHRIGPSEQFREEEIYSLYSRIFLEQLKYLLRPDREERKRCAERRKT
ncbi:MAG: RAMP superfamily CRISPR-associated protein [bacterium]|nr:RAMP superfamily CRISPR-associated protein [bacterium]